MNISNLQTVLSDTEDGTYLVLKIKKQKGEKTLTTKTMQDYSLHVMLKASDVSTDSYQQISLQT